MPTMMDDRELESVNFETRAATLNFSLVTLVFAKMFRNVHAPRTAGHISETRDSRSWNMDLKISEPETQDLGTRVPNLET